MIRLIFLTDFTERFAYNMPPSFKAAYGMEGVLKWAKTWQADAIIGQFGNDDNVDLFRQNGIIALAQDYKERFTNIPNITGDYRKTGQMGAEFFLTKGFRHFAFYGYRDAVWSKERCEGFRECIAAHGFGDNFSAYQHESIDNLWLYDAPPLLAWLKSLPHPTALMACDDNQGNRLTELCKANGISVPDQIAILGVDNDEIVCNLSDPPLSSINHSIVRGGFEAAKLIEQLLNDDEASPQDVVLRPVNVVDRLSTDFHATDDRHIRTVLDHIRQHLASIHKYIFHLRMERFAQLLQDSDAPLAELAAQAGISDLKNLSRQFKALKGTTPNKFRKGFRTLPGWS